MTLRRPAIHIQRSGWTIIETLIVATLLSFVTVGVTASILTWRAEEHAADRQYQCQRDLHRLHLKLHADLLGPSSVSQQDDKRLQIQSQQSRIEYHIEDSRVVRRKTSADGSTARDSFWLGTSRSAHWRVSRHGSGGSVALEWIEDSSGQPSSAALGVRVTWRKLP